MIFFTIALTCTSLGLCAIKGYGIVFAIGALILGAEYSLYKIKLASNLRFGLSNELGSSTTPRLSLGTEFQPAQWFSLLGGASVGGFESFQWSTGINMRLLFLQFRCAYSEYGGMLNFAKGFSLAASTSLVF